MTTPTHVQSWWDAAKPATRGVAIALANAADPTIAVIAPTTTVRREYAKLPEILRSVLALLPDEFYASQGPQVRVRFTLVRNNKDESKEFVCPVFSMAYMVRDTINAMARTGIVAFDVCVDPVPVAITEGDVLP
jgi:hypothetical protein